MRKIKNLNCLNTKLTKLVTIGNSYEQREIVGLQVRRTRFYQHLCILNKRGYTIMQLYPNLDDTSTCFQTTLYC